MTAAKNDTQRSDAEFARTHADCVLAHTELLAIVVDMRNAIGTDHMALLVERASQYLQVLVSNSEYLIRSLQQPPGVDCPDCRGFGRVPGADHKSSPCPACNGTGELG